MFGEYDQYRTEYFHFYIAIIVFEMVTLDTDE